CALQPIGKLIERGLLTNTRRQRFLDPMALGEIMFFLEIRTRRKGGNHGGSPRDAAYWGRGMFINAQTSLHSPPEAACCETGYLGCEGPKCVLFLPPDCRIDGEYIRIAAGEKFKLGQAHVNFVILERAV